MICMYYFIYLFLYLLIHVLMYLLIPQTVLALRGSYGVGFREAPWIRLQSTNAAGQHFPSFLQHKINVTLKSLYVF